MAHRADEWYPADYFPEPEPEKPLTVGRVGDTVPTLGVHDREQREDIQRFMSELERQMEDPVTQKQIDRMRGKE